MDRYERADYRVVSGRDRFGYSGAGALASVIELDATEKPARRQVTLQSGLPLTMMGNDPAPQPEQPRRQVALAIKRIFDVVASALALVLLAPLVLMVAIAIRIESRGPALFRQKREGLHGHAFMAFKFRSMRLEVCDASGVAHTVKGDPRITRVGAFLRKTSIDELPQLLNVLIGQMSIVGPRPHVPGMLAGPQPYRSLVPYYDHRLSMLPGITGWAQANGLRGDASDPVQARARIDHDLAYIENFSLMLDLRILVKTIQQEFFGGTGS
jgi:polysaccharide biosynthesis protein PslA